MDSVFLRNGLLKNKIPCIKTQESTQAFKRKLSTMWVQIQVMVADGFMVK